VALLDNPCRCASCQLVRIVLLHVGRRQLACFEGAERGKKMQAHRHLVILQGGWPHGVLRPIIKPGSQQVTDGHAYVCHHGANLDVEQPLPERVPRLLSGGKGALRLVALAGRSSFSWGRSALR